jgi:hypothetical protein
MERAFDGLFQISIEPLVGVLLRRVAGKIKHFDLPLVLGQPLFERIAVMDTQVIQHAGERGD